MKKFIYGFFICIALALSTIVSAQSASVYLKVVAPGYSFSGGSTSVGYEDQIDVYSFSDGIGGCLPPKQNCVSTFSGFNFMTKASRAIIDLMSVQLQGKTIASADVAWVQQSGNSTFVAYRIHMEDIKVTAVQESASSGGDNLPTVSVSLQPARIAWKIITQNNDATPGPSNTFGWDFSRNVAFTYVFPL